jgi:hypothetical protein
MIDFEESERPGTAVWSTFIGERWKASVRSIGVLAPCATGALFLSAWSAPPQSWMRPKWAHWARAIAYASQGR